MSPSLQISPVKLQYDGNTYSQLSSQQQANIYRELLKRRHSLETLRRESLIIENEPLPSGVAHKAHIDIKSFVPTPKAYPSIERRKAVVIDCEWGQAETRLKEMITVCAVDFLTGEILIDSLAAPSQPIFKWRSHAHGITAEGIEMATRQHKCLRGWREARAKLFEFIDENTILIGHSVYNDLQMLHIFHQTIIDSQILGTAAVFKEPLSRGGYKQIMMEVCKGFLGITIRQNATSSVYENVLASREIVLHYIQRPNDLEEWGRQTKIEYCSTECDKKDAQQPMKGGVALNNQTSADFIQDESQIATAFGDGYETGYQTGFQTGFQKGYEKGYERANTQEDKKRTKNGDLDRSQCENFHKHHGLFHYTDEEDVFDDQNGRLSQNGSDNDDWAPATEIGGLLAQLMKDDRIRKMTQGVNGKEHQKETRGAGTAHVKAYLATGVREAKKEEVSRRARIQARLEALESQKKVPEDQPPKKDCWNSWGNIMD